MKFTARFLSTFSIIFVPRFVQCLLAENVHHHNVDSMQTTGEKLIFAHTHCRHGDRNIYSTYPKDPYNSEEDWPEGFAELTNIGKQQQYELGQYLRQRYASLIEDGLYSPKKVYVESTDIDRVLMSAQCCLAGMFPPVGDQIWDEDLLWQPIPVHVRPNNKEYLFGFGKTCDRYVHNTLDYLNRTNFKGHFEKYKSLVTFLEENSGLELRSIPQIFYLYDQLFVKQLKGKRLPEWAENVMEDSNLQYICKLYFQIATPTSTMKKLVSGFLLKEILNLFTNKIQSTLSPDRSLWMYFGHDNTIASMLNTLGVFEPHRPPYSSCIFFELYDHSEAPPYVQIFYRNTTAVNIQPLVIPDCGTKCPLTRMFDLYKDILPNGSYDQECALHDGEYVPRISRDFIFEI